MNLNINIQNEILTFLDLLDIIKLFKCSPLLINSLSSNEFYEIAEDYCYYKDRTMCKDCDYARYVNGSKLNNLVTDCYHIYRYLYKLDYITSKEKKYNRFRFKCKEFKNKKIIKIIHCPTKKFINRIQCVCLNNKNRIQQIICDGLTCEHHLHNENKWYYFQYMDDVVEKIRKHYEYNDPFYKKHRALSNKNKKHYDDVTSNFFGDFLF